MSGLLLLEQSLNGLQLGVMLFLMAAGLTLIFGIMDFINLAHGSFYMVGAYVAATVMAATGSWTLTVLAGVAAAGLLGMLIEATALKHLYRRNHLDQVLATYALILTFNELTKIIWGPNALFMDIPPALGGTVEIVPGSAYPAYRLVIIGVGALVALGLYLLIGRTRLGMWIRAGAANREMVGALGVNIVLIYTLIFGLGAGLAGLAGAMAGPLLAVQVGMGENILILTFVVVVIGGIGSIKGAVAGAMLVGFVDTFGRSVAPELLRMTLPPAAADAMAASLSSMSVYLLMALVLAIRPQGLFPKHG